MVAEDVARAVDRRPLPAANVHRLRQRGQGHRHAVRACACCVSKNHGPVRHPPQGRRDPANRPGFARPVKLAHPVRRRRQDVHDCFAPSVRLGRRSNRAALIPLMKNRRFVRAHEVREKVAAGTLRVVHAQNSARLRRHWSRNRDRASRVQARGTVRRRARDALKRVRAQPVPAHVVRDVVPESTAQPSLAREREPMMELARLQRKVPGQTQPEQPLSAETSHAGHGAWPSWSSWGDAAWLFSGYRPCLSRLWPEKSRRFSEACQIKS